MLSERRRFHGRRRAIPVAVALLSACGLGISWPAGAGAAGREEPIGYAIGKCSGTDSKPQSKLWYLDGSWWCIIDGPQGNRIFELQGKRWVPQETPDALLGGHEGRADVLWDGRRLVVLLYDKVPALFEFAYDVEPRRYHLEAGFPVPLPIPTGSETMVIDEDSKGWLWATYIADGTVHVAHSGADHRLWELPGQVLRDSTTVDDISTVIAFGGSYVGVLWSDQHREQFAFRVRADADPPDAWGPVEVVDAGHGHADDHVHVCADASGRVYAITKDAHHRLNAHLRAPGGTWTNAFDLLGGGDATRPILMTAEADSQLVLLYTRWHEGDEIVACRTSRLGELAFGAATPFIVVPGQNLNDVTGTKQSLPVGSLVAIADGDGKAWWDGWGPPGGSAGPGRGAGALCELVASPVRPCAGAALALPLDEGAGHEVADASGHGARGQLGGPWADDLAEPAWTRGISGSALRFDGERTYVEVQPAPQLDLVGSMTVEAWVRRTRPNGRETILCKGLPGSRNYQIGFDKKDRVDFVWEAAGGRNHGAEGERAVADTLWHHVACVYDSAGRQSRIYVDGKLDVAAPDSGGVAASGEPLYIGLRMLEKGPREEFEGDIDQVRLTRGVRYAADFTPERGFDIEPGAESVPGAESTPGAVFISWVPRYAGGETPATYDLWRHVASDAAPGVQLDAAPLQQASFLDPSPPAGNLEYEVRRHGGPPSPPLHVTVAWPLVSQWPSSLSSPSSLPSPPPSPPRSPHRRD